MESRDLDKVCYYTERREGNTDVREVNKEVEQGSEARVHKDWRGEHFDALIISFKGGRYTYGI